MEPLEIILRLIDELSAPLAAAREQIRGAVVDVDKSKISADQASVALSHLGDAGGQLASRFNVQQALTDPMGAARLAVDGVTERLGALSLVGGTAFAGAALGAAALVEKAAGVGGHLNDLSEKTGLSVVALSH